jgi:multimeric flavodoxin WrbA
MGFEDLYEIVERPGRMTNSTDHGWHRVPVSRQKDCTSTKWSRQAGCLTGVSEIEMAEILAVIGSPRKGGNTDILVSKIAEGAQAAGAQVETVGLGELQIRECDGCHACWRGRPCSKDDDMRLLYPKIAASETIILGTPVYWYGPTALMKAFIDRFVYFNDEANRPMVRGKRAVVAIVLEETHEQTWRPVVEFFEKSLEYLEMQLAGTIIVAGVGKKGEIREHPQRLEDAYHLGSTLAREVL